MSEQRAHCCVVRVFPVLCICRKRCSFAVAASDIRVHSWIRTGVACGRCCCCCSSSSSCCSHLPRLQSSRLLFLCFLNFRGQRFTDLCDVYYQLLRSRQFSPSEGSVLQLDSLTHIARARAATELTWVHGSFSSHGVRSTLI